MDIEKYEEYKKYKNMSIDEADESELVDINSVEVRMDLPPMMKQKFSEIIINRRA